MSRITIYTDGSCKPNPGPGGWGAVILKDKGIKKLRGTESDTTNNRMELAAVIGALEEISNEECNVHIYSDSGYVVNAVNKKWIDRWERSGWKTKQGSKIKNIDLWIKLGSLIDNHNGRVRLIKVKGHNGDMFNEMVHLIASGAVESLKVSKG